MAAARGAEITVLTSNITVDGINGLAAEWTRETGNQVHVTRGSIGVVKDDILSNTPGDVAVLPPAQLREVASKLEPGAPVPVGRALFGLVVKAGAPHPDISTVKKFADVLRASSGIGFPDPGEKALSGVMMAQMLARPEFAGVTPKPMYENVAVQVAKDHNQYAGGTISEEIDRRGAEVAGAFPAALDMHIDFSAAVLAASAAPAEAAAFIRFISGPKAAQIWNNCGIAAPTNKAKTRNAPCAGLAKVQPPPN
jgi:molybdate transport system substrate-binding protein